MPRLFAHIRDDAEAVACQAVGFDGVVAPPLGLQAVPDSVTIGWIEPGSGGDVLVTVESGVRRRLPLWTDRQPSAADLDWIATAGNAGLVLHSTARLVDALPIPALARIVAEARSRGLATLVAGGLEPPDLPRLAALDIDGLVVGRALRRDDVLDRERMTLARRLVREATPLADVRPVPREADRIFVRDLVLPIAVGAYDSERGRSQRVRFSIDAELTPGEGPMRTLADIVSYDLIADAVRRLTDDRHVDLVETLAEEIAGLLLRTQRIAAVRVRVEKLDLSAGAVGIEIVRGRA